MEIKDVGLKKVIDSLEEKYRLLIDLLYLQGFTQSEAAETLGIPLGTVKTRSKKAVTQLRNLLGPKEMLWPLLWWSIMLSEKMMNSIHKHVSCKNYNEQQ